MRPSEVVEQARQAFHEGAPDRAVELAEHVIARFPRHASARLVRALKAESDGELDQALEDLRFVTSAEPLNARAAAATARIFKQRDDDARAQDEARRVVELVPDVGDSASLESALDILGVDADALPMTPGVFARIHLRSGWPGSAERYARRALDDEPDRIDIRLTLAEALWQLNRLSQCEEQCTIIFDRANDCVRAAVMLAHVLAERGRMAEGQDLLGRAGEIDPEYLEARQMLARLEIHRLVLPEISQIDVPASIRPTDGAPESATTPSASPDHQTPTAAEQPSDDGPPMPDGDSEAEPDGTAFTQIDWARELIRREDWREAERILREIVDDDGLPQADVDALLEEAAGRPEFAATGWQLLGDFRMRAHRPQAAAEAYLRAADSPDATDA